MTDISDKVREMLEKPAVQVNDNYKLQPNNAIPFIGFAQYRKDCPLPFSVQELDFYDTFTTRNDVLNKRFARNIGLFIYNSAIVVYALYTTL